jgi:uncharacterized LabA/DUF88 family protein
MQQPPNLISRPRLALLIDAENARAAQLPQVLAYIAGYGKPTVRRAYGNWMTPQLTPWKKVMQSLGIRPCQQFQHTKGKNASDIALVMDAMDLLHQRNVDGFCIVSSDSDYTGLATRIQEAGLPVHGFGQRGTSPTFVAACETFVFLDGLPVSASEARDALTSPAG